MPKTAPQNQIFWYQRDAALRDRPALILDRDGVVVVEVNYLHRIADVRIESGIKTLIERARMRGLAVGIVSNQSGIGRGLFDWDAFAGVQAEIVRQLDLGPEPFDFVAACGTHPDATLEAMRIADHPWRKPAPGMIQMAAHTLELDLVQSIMIGDHLTDIEAGRRAGVGRLVHVLTGNGGRHRPAVRDLAQQLGAGRVLQIDDPGAAPEALGWLEQERQSD